MEKNLKDTVKILENTIEFKDYDFFPSVVYSDVGMKRIPAEEIDEIDLNGAPPVLKIGNELVFVSAELRSELDEFAKRNRIIAKQRFDIWDAILEPFIDTEFTLENARRNMENLERYGLKEKYVNEWRTKVSETMIAYNFGTGLWDWVHLGLWDLLTAYKISIGEKLTEQEYGELYWESMKVALRSYT